MLSSRRRPRSYRTLAILWIWIVLPLPSRGQTTQGVIRGRVFDGDTGEPVADTLVAYTRSEQGRVVETGSGRTDAQGFYGFSFLTPGTYRVQACVESCDLSSRRTPLAGEYQPQEIAELELNVASRLEVNFALRKLTAVWKAGIQGGLYQDSTTAIVHYYASDVAQLRSAYLQLVPARSEPLESSVSSVIDSAQLERLPLLGRDAYTILATVPGVSSDSAARGLGLAVNGQRPSSSNFLLDGLENNNYLNTGPLASVAPEAIQEYRISTNNFSAEYGRTAGFVANAVTRRGSNQLHANTYLYLKNEALDANGFQENRVFLKRGRTREWQPGFVVGGPVLRNRLFFASSYESLRGNAEGAPVTLPNTRVLLEVLALLPKGIAYQILNQFPPPRATGSGNYPFAIAPPITQDRQLALERLDHSSPDGKNRIMGRFLLSRLTRPDFIWTPYPDFGSTLHQNTWSLGGSYLRILGPGLTSEARVNTSSDDLNWNRPHPEIPTLISGDGIFLPGSPAFYAYQNVSRSTEALDNVIWSRGRHLITAGGGVLWRNSNGAQTFGRDGSYVFPNSIAFAMDKPILLGVALDRSALPALVQPQYDRNYSYRQYFAFAQDTFKVSRRLTVNFGIRYERFGAPVNTGAAKDLLVQLGPGATLAQQLTGATLPAAGQGNQPLFHTDGRDWAVRGGASYDLTGNGRTLVRGGYGIFYDRPYDNIWQALRINSLTLATFPLKGVQNVLTPISTVIAGFQGTSVDSSFPGLSVVNPDLKNGLVYSYFAGVQQRFSEALTLEVNAQGSYGRRLITTDIVNRDFSTLTGRYNQALPDIQYRDGQGSSAYNALTALARYRTTRGFLQAGYTWSHTIDNQSDALAGDLNFDLTFIPLAHSPNSSVTFSQQFNPNADRASSDFDQRHNFVVQGYWNPQPFFAHSRAGILFRDWNFGTLLHIASGFPFSLLGTTNAIPGLGYAFNNRPDLIDPAHARASRPDPLNGGVILLNATAFRNAASSTLGNVGRNAFTGPGFYNFDLSVGRTVPLRWLREGAHGNIRADLFNALNHANLGNSIDTLLTSPTFGLATFGHRASHGLQFPEALPFDELPRQIQLSVRIEF